jgi:gluconate 2-dehydrogenase gamma chain
MFKATAGQALRIAVSWYKNLSRREFIQLAAAASGTVSCSGSRSPWRFLRTGEARTLAAICDQLIPPDADPGADWAQVVNFIDVQLCGPFRELQPLYHDGIACVDQTSQSKFGKAFAELTSDQQFGILAALEQGAAPKDIWKTVAPRAFFETVLAHTMQGFYGDPRHGGNRARASWKMVGLTYPPVRGRLKYDASKT